MKKAEENGDEGAAQSKKNENNQQKSKRAVQLMWPDQQYTHTYTHCMVGVGRGQSNPGQSERGRNRARKVGRKTKKIWVNFGGVPWRFGAKNRKTNPPSRPARPLGYNMAQEPDRYHLPVFRAMAPRFRPLTRVRKFENFQKNSPSPTPWPKSPKFCKLVGGGYTP